MKILLLTNSFENIVNGPAKFANLILRINDIYPDHQIRVLTEDISVQKLAQTKYVYRVALTYPKFLQGLGQLLRMFIYYKKARQIAKEYNYDVLLYINAFNGLWAAMVSKKPTMGMINDDNNLSTSLSNFKPTPTWFKKYIFKFLERTSVHFHRSIISNSDYLTQELIKTYSIPTSKIHRLYKAIDLSDIEFKPDRAFTYPVKILFVKADFRRGGLHTLAEAMGQLNSIPFILTIIGPHQRFEKQIYSFFEKYTHIQVRFLAEQPQKVVYQQLNNNDIFCVPSLKEALGVANIEALAFGIPVISTQTGGIPEVLNYGNNGWLVHPDKPGELAAAIKICIENKAEREKKSANGRRFIDKFSIKNMFEDFTSIIEKCL